MSSTTDGYLLSLKFVVIGGGIAGLSTAFALQRAGHRVLVLEKRDAKHMSFSKVGGGIRAPPNMTRLLYRWGLAPILAQKALKCERLVYVNANTGRLLGAIFLNEEFLKDLIADMLLIQHGDLVHMLHDLASREGVEIRHNAKVVYANPDGSSVRLDTGETISADLLIVADGFSSLIRSQVTGYSRDLYTMPLSRVLFVAFTVDTRRLEDDEDFKAVLRHTDWLTWMAEDTIVHTHTNKGVMIGTLSRDYYGEVREGDEDWSDKRDLQSYGLDFTLLDPRLRRLFELAETVTSCTFVKRPMPEELTNEYSSAVLVGEAAHPLVCESGHGTALVIEDAETLGSLFSDIHCRSEISQRLTAYEEIRHSRCYQTNLRHQRLDSVMKLPVGPRQKSRDLILRRILAYSEVDQMEPDEFQVVFGEQALSFAYDAGDAVDDWWVTWGFSNRYTRRQSPPLQVWITRS